MSKKKLETQAFFLIDADEYKSFAQLKQQNSELERQLSEALKYKRVSDSAHQSTSENSGLKKIPSSVTTETLESSEKNEVNQTGSGLNDVVSAPPTPSINLSEEDSFRLKLFEAFQTFMKSQDIKNQTGSGNSDLTPYIAIPMDSSEDAQAEASTSGTIVNEKKVPESNNATLTSANVEHSKLLDLLPSKQRPKAKELLEQMKNFSEDISVNESGTVNINGETLASSNFSEIFPLLFKSLKNYDSDANLVKVVNELLSLGLGHLINRSYSRGLIPLGKNYLKNRPDIRSHIKKHERWYYLGSE